MTHGARTDRVGERIRAELSALLLRRVREPGVNGLTITHVQVTRDLQLARVYFRVIEDGRSLRDAARALRRARGFLRHELGQRLQLRRVPELTFLHDDTVDQQERIARLLDEIQADRPDAGTGEHDA